MTAVAEAVGFISGVMGIWQFIGDQLPSQESDKSAYRVVIGLEGTTDDDGDGSLSNAGGEIELIKTYNNNGELFGSGSGGKIDNDDQYGDMAVEQNGNAQATFTEFYAGNDAICIAAITNTMADDSKWGWTGDWGYICGMNWFPSGYQMKSSEGENRSPKCTWIDKDHTNDLKAGVMGIDWVKLDTDGTKLSWDEARAKCGSEMKAWPNDGEDQMLPIEDSNRRMKSADSGLHRTSQRSDDRLVVSRLASHNATEVCESSSSWGPDFVAEAEGVYCNMETHETAPLCSVESGVDCFDLEHPLGPAMVRRNGKRSFRKPSKVITWE